MPFLLPKFYQLTLQCVNDKPMFQKLNKADPFKLFLVSDFLICFVGCQFSGLGVKKGVIIHVLLKEDQGLRSFAAHTKIYGSTPPSRGGFVAVVFHFSQFSSSQ